MCRNIKRLYNLDPCATRDEVRESALQYVRKISGMRTPSQANQEAFDQAVEAITEIGWRLLDQDLETRAAPRDRALEAEAARKRGQRREARMRAELAGD
ncbi:MAG: DUF2277 domain-containing protein [Myxococcota bacterium]|nr:DUF2277 domain-containing protein [Myxococcota bacterium]